MHGKILKGLNLFKYTRILQRCSNKCESYYYNLGIGTNKFENFKKYTINHYYNYYYII